MKRSALGMIAIVLLASTAPAALAAQQRSSAYAGSTIAFDATSTALVDYSVDGTTMAESVRVQSKSETESALSLGASADLGAVVNLTGASLSVESNAETNATVRSDSGAVIHAHDNGHGSLVVESDGEAQYVEVGLGADASAAAESDRRVVVTSGDGTKGAFVVAGEGSVTVNEAGNVSAEVGSDGRLVFRAYPDGRSEADANVEALIADGTAAASVHLTGNGTDVVSYDGNTSIAVTQRSEGNVSMSVERASHQGKVVVTSVAEGTFESVEDLQVTVDGEAAARASTYGELATAADGGDASKYMVRQRSGASAEVLVGINHFSTREVTMRDASRSDGGSTASGATETEATQGEETDDGTAGTSSGSGPGFGVVAALLAIGGTLAVVGHRRD